jgi:lysophospholipase L1-like esterase
MPCRPIGYDGGTAVQQILVYADSLSWGIVPGTRARHPFEVRWPGRLETRLQAGGRTVRVIEDCLNGRRTVWEDPFKPGRNGLEGLAKRIEIHSPLALVILLLGTNDVQSVHAVEAWHAAQGVATLVGAIRTAPIEPGMPVPPVLVVAPPPIGVPRGAIAPKFSGAPAKSAGLAEAYREVAAALGCPYFDAANVVSSSAVDGVHLDAEAHLALGDALAEVVLRLI